MISNSNSYSIYIGRIQDVIKYISDNISGKLDLNTLAMVSYFSPFHFHRIFSGIVNETPLDFVNRIRLEKAANFITLNHNLALSEIAYECGFSSPSVFSRAFKKHFGVSASQWKKIKAGNNSSIQITNGEYIAGNQRNPVSSIQPEVKYVTGVTVAYTSNFRGYKQDKIAAAWSKIYSWASSNNLINGSTIFIGVSFDNPEITPEEKCRYYACVSVPPETGVDKGIGKMDLPAGLYCVYRFKGEIKEIEKTYKDLYAGWLPASGYQPADHPCYEVYYKDPEKDPKGSVDMEIYLPIKSLRG